MKAQVAAALKGVSWGLRAQFVGNVRKAVHQIEKREAEAAEAAEAAEQEKILKVSP